MVLIYWKENGKNHITAFSNNIEAFKFRDKLILKGNKNYRIVFN